MGWNYRICTHVFSYKKTFVNNPKLAANEDQRIFAIHSVYYDKNGVPEGTSKNPESLGGFEELDSLKDSIEKIQEALSKPIIDLDNFPNEWKDETSL